MARILETRDSHYLVQRDDGSVELVTRTDMNILIYEHNLAGLLKRGDEVINIGDDPRVQLIPNDDATEFTLRIGDDEFEVATHHKAALVKALLDAYDTGAEPTTRPLLDFAGQLMDTAVNRNVVDRLADEPPFDTHVEVTENGWLINDHLLLTYDNEFYHPSTTRVDSSGSVVSGGSNKLAYDLRFDHRPDDHGQIALDSFDYLGDTDDQVEFVARAYWAITYAPTSIPDADADEEADTE